MFDNHRNLTKVQKRLGSFTENYLAQALDQRVDTKQNARNILVTQELSKCSSFNSLVSNSDKAFSQMIDLLREQKDFYAGISWHRKKDTDGNLYLIRDSRYAKPAEKQYNNIAYQIQFVNLARATVKLLELQKSQSFDDIEKEKIEQDINAIKLRVSKQNLENVDLKILTQAKKSFIKILKKAGLEGKEDEISKQLNTAKDFVSMNDKQYNMATISQAKYKTRKAVVVECNHMLTGLTESQKQQYRDIASGQAEILVSLGKKDKSAYCAWYTSLSKADRSLVMHYASRIADGTVKILPTQLLKQLIGVRNGYCKSTTTMSIQHEGSVKGEQRYKGLKPSITSYHCGTVAFLGKGNAQEVTNENVRQLETFLPNKDKKLALNILNTPWNRKEARIVSQSVKAAKVTGNISALTPINGFRGWFGNKNKGLKSGLDFLANKLSSSEEERIQKVVRYLKSSKKEAYDEAKAAIENLPMDKLSQELKHIIEAKKLLQYSSSFFGRLKMAFYDPENTNLQLAARMGLVEAAVEHGILRGKLSNEDCNKFPKLVVKCKSGKDRTGGVEFLEAVYSTCDELGIDSTKQKIMQSKEVLEGVVKPLIDGMHTQALAAMNGGTPGAYGIKVEGMSFLPKSWQKGLKGLEQDAAKYNDIKRYKVKITGEYIADADAAKADEMIKANIKAVEKDKAVVRKPASYSEKVKPKSQRAQNQTNIGIV